jgi:uncharacterized protein with ATP-grasp and redox domains
MAEKHPPPIFGTEAGSWAQLTISDRYSNIVNRVIDENDFPPDIVEKLVKLRDEIPDQPIRYLRDPGAPDIKDWETYIKPMEGKDWMVVPWLFSEHYMYRRIMEAVDYFNLRQDPFRYQKQQSLNKNREDIQSFASVLMSWTKDRSNAQQYIRKAIYYSLWGNQADLSLWPADKPKKPNHLSQKNRKEYLLADDTNRIVKLLSQSDRKIGRVDIMLDNAGYELVCDLGLVDTLLTHQQAVEVLLHTKAHPTYVSDVIGIDVDQTIGFLKNAKADETSQLGKRLEEYIQEKKLKVKSHFFWNSPLPMWNLPADLREQLSRADLLISKGDANYRRLLGDLQWDFTIPFHQVVDYLPVPLAALRTLKAELAVGLDLDQIREVYNQDPDWLTDGKWGVVHFAPGLKNQD